MTDHKFIRILNRLFYPLLRVTPLVILLLVASQLAYGIGVVFASSFLVATKSDILVVDEDKDNLAGPGDTIRYTTWVTNTSNLNAAAVVFNDTIDPNTTLVPGSTRTTPIARHDLYASLGNVGITVPAGSGVLANDNDPDGTTPTLTVIAAAGGTANGGAFAIVADGSFSYLPPAGFEGSDSFTYKVQDSDGNQDPATVFITVTDVIWFIDNSQSSSGSGVLSNPFNSLSGFNSSAADEAGDIIFIYSGSGNYSSGITLLNNQILIGQGATASIASIAGITVPPFSNALPATGGARPTITTTSGDGVVVAQNNTLLGFNVGNTAGVGISDNGGTVGTLTASEIAISGTGGGIEVDNGGTLAVTLDGLSAASSSDEGVDLENVSGSFAVTGTSGTLNMSGVPAVVIDGNPSLNINTLSFQSVGSTNAAHGISIRDTTGSFTVTGTGTTDGSGGTLQNISGSGVHLENTANISLANMNINFTAQSPPVVTGSPTCDDEDSGTNTSCVAAVHMVSASNVSLTNLTINDSNQHGINGNNVSGLSVLNSTLTNIGDSTLENGLNFINLLGTVTFNNLSVDGSQTRNALIENNQGAATINVTNSTVNNAVGEDGFHVVGGSNGGNNANITLNVTDSSFIHNHSVQLKAHAEDNSSVDVNITGNTFDGEPTVVGNVGIDLAARDSATLTFDVTGTGGNPQTFLPFRSHAVNVFLFGGANGSGTISGNTIQGSEVGAGVRAIAEVTTSGNPSLVIDVSNNNISNIEGVGLAGIDIRSRQGVVAATGVANVQATVDNNAVGVTSTADANIQFYINSGNALCAAVTNNAASGTPSFGNAFYVGNPVSGDPSGAGTAQLSGWTGDIDTTWNNNGNTPINSAFLDGTINGTCTPSVPTASITANTVVVEVGEGAPMVTTDFVDRAASALFAMKRALVSLADRTQNAIDQILGMANALIANLQPTTARASGETISLTLGDLNPHQAVKITFDVTVDDPQSPATNSQICNQGLFSGNSLTSVATDDPDVAGGGVAPTCTKLAPGTIVIAKDQSPNGSESFGFSSNIPDNATFNVSGDNSVTIHNVPADSYTVTEDDPSASFFALTGLSCDDGGSAAPSTTDLGTRTATINLESGETVTCTFTNEEIGRLEVVKSVDATPTGETFDLLIDGNVEASGVGDGGSTGEVGVATGNHTVSETGTNLGNYDSSIVCVLDGTSTVVASGGGTSLANVPVNAGDDVVCTITNTHKTGSLEVVKNLVPATDTGSFDMRIDTTAHVATGGDGTTTGEQSVPIGTHLVSETGDGATNLFDYTVSISCKDNNGTGSEVTATPNGAFAWDVTVNEGNDIVCTITNQRNSTILVQKTVVQGDPNNPNQIFNLNISLGSTVLGQSSVLPGSTPVGLGNLTPDTYTVNEVNLAPGWRLEDISCANNFGNSTFGTFTPGDNSLEVMLAPGSEVLCTFTNTFNQPPAANDDSYTATEDTTLNVAAPGVLDNDTDADGDTLTAMKDSDPSHGTLTLSDDGSFSYTPDADYCGPDSFTYHANDGMADSNVATVNITVACVDDPPVVSVDVASQTVQYSDHIVDVTVSASDVDSSSLTISDNAPTNLSTSGSCTSSGDGTSCTWTLSGQVLVASGMYDLTFIVSDATNGVNVGTQINVNAEDATVAFDGGNPVSVLVDSPGGDSGPFSLTVYVSETEPDQPASSAAPGNINLADVSVKLQPVGPGSSVMGSCTSSSVTPFDYKAVLTVECDFSGVPVNTYTVEVTVDGGYYAGSGEDVLTVYDPSLGFTTGGGWFYWPGTTDRTNFGYTMKYNKKGTNVKGSLLLIRHLSDGTKYRVKSNALDGLALGEDDNGTFGWATFTGKTTYLKPGWSEPEGNYAFTVYVEDHGEPGAGADRFWIEIRDKGGNVVGALSMDSPAHDNPETIQGGNIVVPHSSSSKGKNK